MRFSLSSSTSFGSAGPRPLARARRVPATRRFPCTPGPWCVLAIVICALPSVDRRLVARDLHVHNTAGDDRADGSGATPYRTISRALAAAQKSDRVVIAKTDEPYREALTIQAGRHTGIEARPFEIVGNGATLDGSVQVPDDAWEHYEADVYRFRPEAKHHHLLFLNGVPALRKRISPTAPVPELAPREWCLSRGHVYFRVQGGRNPTDYSLTHTALPVGITLYEVRHVVIRDLIVQGFQLDGVNAHDSVFDGALVGLTCRGNGRSGVSVGGSSRVRLVDCVVGNNGTCQVRTEGSSRTEIIACDLIRDGDLPTIERAGGRVHVAPASSAAGR